ncbi:MAG: 16S rRNA (guanine(966)-N(2))-methyltransferase RsmD [bacterium]
MKIIGGIYKGREIKGPRSKSIRPTLAKVREAFFDIINGDIEGAYFLDLYAGTGAMGIEALSRGASKVYFVDHSKVSATLLSKNLAFIDSNLYVIVRMDIMRALEHIRLKNIKFDIAYIDPPYGNITAYTHVLKNMILYDIMNNRFIIGIEHNKAPESLFHGLFPDIIVKVYNYGDTNLTVLRRL